MAAFLREHRIATLGEIKAVLGTTVDSTVFRKLSELTSRTSYSHRGRYYTLDEIVRFDQLGLWSFRSVWFSKHGTLLRTCEVFVDESEAGYSTDELENVLNVGVKDPLRKLAREGRLHREEVAGRFVRFAVDTARRREQLRSRQVWDAKPSDLPFGPGARVVPDELKAAIILFFSILDEGQRPHPKTRAAKHHARRFAFALTPPPAGWCVTTLCGSVECRVQTRPRGQTPAPR